MLPSFCSKIRIVIALIAFIPLVAIGLIILVQSNTVDAQSMNRPIQNKGKNRMTPTPSIQATSTITSTPFATQIPTVTHSPTSTPTVTPVILSRPSWAIQSVSSMKLSKDRLCNQPDDNFINKWVAKAYELGVNYISIETPYDSPLCANAPSYTKRWIQIIRKHNLKVWHRHMPLAFEGIYDKAKVKSTQYLQEIANYIISNPDEFAVGDIFTPIPEPQNGGIYGVTYCAQDVCQFDGASHFNSWLRESIDTSSQAFSQIGLGNMIKIGFFGFDGFVAWGDNNPDWEGILEKETVEKMGNITIDHYPELIGSTMKDGLDQLEKKFPGVPIIIGEWGAVTDMDAMTTINSSMGAAKRPSVIGFNYWHMGMGGNESLINDDFTEKKQFEYVQKFYKSQL